MLAFSNKKSTIDLVSGIFFCYCIFLIFPCYYLKIIFFTKKAPQTTIISVFYAKLHQFMKKFCLIYADKNSNNILFLHKVKSFRVN